MQLSTNVNSSSMALAQCCGYFGSFLLIVISSFALLTLLLTYFKHIRTLFYVEGNCTITTSFYTVQYPCNCGRGCESFYPCLLLYSRIDSSHMDNTVSQWPVVLYDSDWQQIFVNNAKEDLRQRCTTRTCYYDRQLNREAMELYYKDHERGQSFPCYFHPASVVTDGVVLTRSIHWSLAVHVTVWPGLGIAIGFTVCIYTYIWKKRHRSIKTRNGKQTKSAQMRLLNANKKSRI